MALTIGLKEGSNYFSPGVHEVTLTGITATKDASTPYITFTFSQGAKEFSKRFYFKHSFAQLEKADGLSKEQVESILGAGTTDPRKTSTFISLETLKHLLVFGRLLHAFNADAEKLFDKIVFADVNTYVADLIKAKIQGKKLKLNLAQKLNKKDGKNYLDFTGYPFASGNMENTLIPVSPPPGGAESASKDSGSHLPPAEN